MATVEVLSTCPQDGLAELAEMMANIQEAPGMEQAVSQPEVQHLLASELTAASEESGI